MSPPKALVLPTAKPHSTLYTYPDCYHKFLFIFSLLALLALTVNAADTPPQYRQYKHTRSLAPKNVKRKPAALLGQNLRVVSIYAAVATLNEH